jgi:YebC/PmpR family DNA-binding regulatory protein
MSGHSKWSTIKHKKAAKDAKRGKVFTKLIKEITVAARLGGGDINGNPRLRTAVLTARQNSMPSDNIDRAIKKGTGELQGVSYEEIVYEGYGPGGVAIMVTCLTDNKNRTLPEIRKIFERGGGSLGAQNCVAWMFSRKGLISVDKGTVDEDRLMEVTLEAGASDLQDLDDAFEIVTTPEAFEPVKEAIDRAGIATARAELCLQPENSVTVSGQDAERTLRLVEELEDHDDIQTVASNFDIPQEELERLSA